MPEEETVHSRHFLLTATVAVNDVMTATYSTTYFQLPAGAARPGTISAGN